MLEMILTATIALVGLCRALKTSPKDPFPRSARIAKSLERFRSVEICEKKRGEKDSKLPVVEEDEEEEEFRVCKCSRSDSLGGGDRIGVE